MSQNSDIVLKDHKIFFVGGTDFKINNKVFKRGQMYVESFKPKNTNGKKIILIHGGGQSGAGFISTADGRRGWLHNFLDKGYEVYIVDQPGRARSGYSENLYGKYLERETNLDDAERRFTAMSTKGNWPQAKTHTELPSNGIRGDQVFEQYMASQVNTMADRIDIEEMSKIALSELIDKIGDTAVLGHSQGGPFCWLAADVRPKQVKACVAVEPNGPPFFNVSYGGIQHSHLDKQTFKKNDFDKGWYQTSSEPDRPNGITYSALTYDPPLKQGEKLIPEIDTQKTPDNLVQCFLQKEPARKLVNLSKTKILILTAESSYHAPYDHGTSNFLKQAGVNHDFIRLEDHKIKGNGHMMMHEKNSNEVSNFIMNWLDKNYG